ncbi:Syntaxin-41 [Vitis vinifera]|uniref:Syntaxin-41 n=1 Tax=Vitis vinifera TaxID=29760 RepID=A0A438IM33_VITVI|nr:Syntaxin-41 [Vitis vinifera]
MASRNRTLLYRKYRDALKSVRVPVSSSLSSSTPSTSSGGGPVIELVSTSLLNPNRSYVPLSTEDPGNSSLVLYPLCIDSWKRLEFVLNSWAL